MNSILMADVVNLADSVAVQAASNLQTGAAVKLKTSFGCVDDELSGGIPECGAIEIVCKYIGIGEVSMISSVLKLLHTRKPGYGIWINPPGQLSCEGLNRLDVDTEHTVVLTTSCNADLMWCVDKAIQSNACRYLVMWADGLTAQEMRRIQVGARAKDILAIILSTQLPSESRPVAMAIELRADLQGLFLAVRKQQGSWPVREFKATSYSIGCFSDKALQHVSTFNREFLADKESFDRQIEHTGSHKPINEGAEYQNVESKGVYEHAVETARVYSFPPSPVRSEY